MTKQEAYNRFYEGLSQEEKAAGPDALPDFVKYLPLEQLKLSKKDLEWAKEVANKFEKEEY